MNAAAVAEKNFRLVHAPSDYFYLDCGAGEWIGDDVAYVDLKHSAPGRYF